MGKTRDLFGKIGYIKETFQASIDMIKDRNSKAITEVEEMKRKWQEYTKELYKKGLMHGVEICKLSDPNEDCSLVSLSWSSPTGSQSSDGFYAF